jgi:hypothetical protein
LAKTLTMSNNLKIRQTWIEEHIEEIESNFKSKDEAFLFLAASLIFDLDIESIDPEDIIEGSGDKQLDIIKITDNTEQSEAEIDIIQVKNNTGFSSNTVIQISNGLKWLFEKKKADYLKLKNAELIEKIKEIRELRKTYGASNLSVNVFYVTKGDVMQLSSEYIEERQTLKDVFSNLGFSKFEYKEIGAIELLEFIEVRERSKKRIDLNIPIVYDTNKPSLLSYAVGDTRALICTVTGETLAEIGNTQPKDAIFDLNVRQFYGLRGKVNKDILSTCKGDESKRFWFLNNGITMVCDSFDEIRDPDYPTVKVKNAQIVNGCQTTVTIREAFEQNSLAKDVKVLLKIFATDNPTLVERITLTTNNQNKITDRDLRANEAIQRDIQRMISEKYGYYYERKNKEYQSLTIKQKKFIVPNFKAGQAYLAIVRNKPSNAKGYLAAIWSDFYKEIYSEATAGDLVASFLIFKYCQKKAKEAKKSIKIKIKREVMVYGIFHLCRLLGFYLVKDKWGQDHISDVDFFIRANHSLKSEFENAYIKAVKILVEIRKEDKKEYPISALYFKSRSSQNKLLHKLQTFRNN